jgi:hypothetical protein
MEKEIETSGERHSFSNTHIEKLIEDLSAFLAKIDRGTRLQNLLYRVDVDLQKVNPKLPHYEAVSVLLWNRVLQKIWFREQFKIGNI